VLEMAQPHEKYEASNMEDILPLKLSGSPLVRPSARLYHQNPAAI